eukprot:5022894-Pyramimonas_sp.AAC.2
MDSTTTADGKMPEVRVATYNILSSKLARSEQFPSCAPEDLRANVRYKRILPKLEAEMAQGSILCLQEVTSSLSQPCLSVFSSHALQIWFKDVVSEP